MTCGNPLKHKTKKLIGNFLDNFIVARKLNDKEIECKQFGICDYAPNQTEEIPYFHFWLFLIFQIFFSLFNYSNVDLFYFKWHLEKKFLKEVTFLKEKGFNLTQGMVLLLLKPLNLPANYVMHLILWITNPVNNIGYDN